MWECVNSNLSMLSDLNVYRLEKMSRYWFSHRAVIHLIDTNSPSRPAAAMRRGAVVPTSPSSGATPVRVKDVADVAIGRELRTSSASVNGHEAVLGTALMLVGGNSWTVAAAADAKIKEINKSLPPGIQARTLLNRTRLVDATIKVTCLKPAPSIKLFWLSH